MIHEDNNVITETFKIYVIEGIPRQIMENDDILTGCDKE